ncbi:hypothetical protein ZWY2020_014132 [Hordeum vulgare]|nr:hypothetical protein ZWY2020_014132 [Hordeum vulgare]
MVSLVGSQILSPKQRPCARLRCSMRRSAPFRPGLRPQPAAADDGDSDIDNLTHSVLDFRLSELAATVGPMHPAAVAKSSFTNTAATEMLELSRDFSDYSSCNSDISGELERLAAAAATPRSDAPDLAAVDLNDLESMDLSADVVPLECVEPSGRAQRWVRCRADGRRRRDKVVGKHRRTSASLSASGAISRWFRYREHRPWRRRTR